MRGELGGEIRGKIRGKMRKKFPMERFILGGHFSDQFSDRFRDPLSSAFINLINTRDNTTERAELVRFGIYHLDRSWRLHNTYAEATSKDTLSAVYNKGAKRTSLLTSPCFVNNLISELKQVDMPSPRPELANIRSIDNHQFECSPGHTLVLNKSVKFPVQTIVLNFQYEGVFKVMGNYKYRRNSIENQELKARYQQLVEQSTLDIEKSWKNMYQPFLSTYPVNEEHILSHAIKVETYQKDRHLPRICLEIGCGARNSKGRQSCTECGSADLVNSEATPPFEKTFKGCKKADYDKYSYAVNSLNAVPDKPLQFLYPETVIDENPNCVDAIIRVLEEMFGDVLYDDSDDIREMIFLASVQG